MLYRSHLLRLGSLITWVMLAFAANSLLCRLALKTTSIDPATFSSLRIISGAAVLWLVAFRRNVSVNNQGTWPGAVALFIYVVGFSYAYVTLAVGTGTLLLFGAVQLTMISAGLIAGERMNVVQIVGVVAAGSGLVVLVLPGVQTPAFFGALLMTVSGIAWGAYSLLGRAASNPTAVTAGNFMRASTLAIGLSLIALPWFEIDMRGALYAILSGALASGVGYALWYRVVRELHAIQSASVQMIAPALAALGGMLLLNEPVTLHFIVAAVLTLGGIWLVLRSKFER